MVFFGSLETGVVNSLKLHPLALVGGQAGMPDGCIRASCVIFCGCFRAAD